LKKKGKCTIEFLKNGKKLGVASSDLPYESLKIVISASSSSMGKFV
jgi:hypothetical protein